MCCFSTSTSCVLPSCLSLSLSLRILDWHLTLMIRASPQSVCQLFTAARRLLYSLFSLSQRFDISICLFFPLFFTERFAKKCISMTNCNYWDTKTHIHMHTGHVLDNRMCGGYFTGFSHSFRIAPQPYCFRLNSGVYICMCVCVSKTVLCLSALADIQNSKSKNKEAEILYLFIFLSVLDGLNPEHFTQSLTRGTHRLYVCVYTICECVVKNGQQSALNLRILLLKESKKYLK